MEKKRSKNANVVLHGEREEDEDEVEEVIVFADKEERRKDEEI